MQSVRVNMITYQKQLFYMVGTIEEAIEKAQKNGKRSCSLMSEEFKIEIVNPEKSFWSKKMYQK